MFIWTFLLDGVQLTGEECGAFYVAEVFSFFVYKMLKTKKNEKLSENL
jgi:hypothetical protein